MARDVEHVVHAAENPEVAVTVALRPVAGKVDAFPLAPVRGAVAGVVSVDGAKHAGPGARDGEKPAARGHFLTLAVQQGRLDAREGNRGGAGPGGHHAGERRDHDAARLGLPPGVDDGTPAAPDMALIPDPGFGIDGFADGSEQPQRGQVVLLGERGPPLHERANGRRRRVEDRDPIALDEIPEPVLVRPIRGPLVHDAGGAGGQRAVHQVRVPGHPADIRRAPEHVVVPQVEHPSGGRERLGHVAAGGVHDALRLPGRPRRVEDVEHVLRVHHGGLADRLGIGHQAVVPMIPPLDDGGQSGIGGCRATTHHDDVLDGRAAGDRLIGVLLERDELAAAVPDVGRDQHLRGRVVDAIAEGLGREPAEHNGVGGADPRAGQHGDHRLGDHRQVDRHAVALAHAEPFQDVREPVDVAMQLPVGDRAPIARLPFPEQGDLVAPLGAHVPVETVHGSVELATDEPLGVGRFPRQHPAPRLHPFELAGLPFPELEPVAGGLLIRAPRAHLGRAAKGGRGRETAGFVQQRVDAIRHDLTLALSCRAGVDARVGERLSCAVRRGDGRINMGMVVAGGKGWPQARRKGQVWATRGRGPESCLLRTRPVCGGRTSAS